MSYSLGQAATCTFQPEINQILIWCSGMINMKNELQLMEPFFVKVPPINTKQKSGTNILVQVRQTVHACVEANQRDIFSLLVLTFFALTENLEK
jgi:hypothetical protein